MTSGRTQAERTATTRAALIDAALDLLDEVGWAATTSVAVCERAGLTRGALVHHFGDLPTLLAEALDTHYLRLSRTRGGRPQAAPATMVELVESTWRAVEGGRFKVVIEAWLAAANDPDLAVALGPVIARFAKLVQPASLIEGADAAVDPLAEPEDRELYLVLREAMLGLALGRATSGGPLAHEATVLEGLHRLAADHDARRQRANP